jgi:hypothetical protein
VANFDSDDMATRSWSISTGGRQPALAAIRLDFTTDVDADCGQFKSDFAAFHDPFGSTQHTMSTHVVDVDGTVLVRRLAPGA